MFSTTANKTLALLLILVFVVYYQVINFTFLNIDDTVYVVGNPIVASGIAPANILSAFTSFYAANWHPVTWISHVIDVQLFGLWPGGHHMTAVLLHVASIFLLYLLCTTLFAKRWLALLAAALFALHPLRVESVAWISERKDVLSMLFLLMSLLSYCRYTVKQTVESYMSSLCLFIIGLMSKQMLVTLPLLLLLMDWWPLCRVKNATAVSSVNCRQAVERSYSWLLAEKIPFFILSIISGIIAIYAQRSGTALVSTTVVTVYERFITSILSYQWYITKLLWPVDLAFYYPRTSDVQTLHLILATIILIGITVYVVMNRQCKPVLLFGWYWFVVTLLPVIGLITVGMQATADRYTYIPSIGLIIIVAWYCCRFAEKSTVRTQTIIVLTAAILIILTYMTWRQIGTWRDNRTLSEHALKVTSNNYVAQTLYGDVLDGDGRSGEAIAYYKEALRIMPRYEIAYNSMGIAQTHLGLFAEAMDSFNRALAVNSDYIDVYVNIGVCFANQGNYRDALRYFEIARQHDPRYPHITEYIDQAKNDLRR